MNDMKQDIKHHLSEELLLGYAAGSLPEAFNLVVATHVSLCDDCRAALAAYDAVGGEVLMAGEAEQLSDGSLAATLAMIAVEVPAARLLTPANDGIFPAPLQAYVAGDLDKVKWRGMGGGISQMILKTSPEAVVRLLRIPAGTAVPDHGHRGTELTLVLQGAFCDDIDCFSAGDVEVANEEVVHTPVAKPGLDCICLAATDAPLRFSQFIPRVAQRFLKI